MTRNAQRARKTRKTRKEGKGKPAPGSENTKTSKSKKARVAETVDDFEDDEIDEDEAFNSDDERKYGEFFSHSKCASQKKLSRQDDEEDTEEYEREHKNSEDVSSGSDDDNSSGSDDDVMIESEDGNDEKQGDGGQYMLQLLENIDKVNGSNPKATTKEEGQLVSQIKESEYSASVVRGTNLTMDQLMGGISDTKGFKSLQKNIASLSGYRYPFDGDSNDKKILKTTSAPSSRVVSERAARKVHYQERKEDISRWAESVKRNREAESLDFRPKTRIRVTRDDLVEKFEAETDFEFEIADALEKADTSEVSQVAELQRKKILGSEDEDEDDLGRNKVTLEEFKRRRGELAKMRALLFYEEQKAHHMNKIKSKKYRKIRKRQRENIKQKEMTSQAEEDSGFARELQEKEELERMKERMTLAHKNTSKWARQQLKRGKNMDIDTRRALSAQIKMGDELRQKMKTIRASDDSEEDDPDENIEDLVTRAKEILEETTHDASQGDPSKEERKGLFAMKFMQRGIQAQKERAKEEARKLLEELEASMDDNESDFSDAESELCSGKTSGGALAKQSFAKASTPRRTADILPLGKMVTSDVEFGKSDSVALSGSISIDNPVDAQTPLERPDNGKIDAYAENEKNRDRDSGVTESVHTTSMTVSKRDVPNGTQRSTEPCTVERQIGSVQTSSDRGKVAVISNETKDEPQVNPWFQGEKSTTPVGAADRKETKTREDKRAKNAIIDVKGAAAAILSEKNEAHTVQDEKKSEDETDFIGAGAVELTPTVSLSQEELIRKAFAAPTISEMEKDLEQEKEAMRERNGPARKKLEENKSVSGWGSWAGEGVKSPPPRRKKFPKRLEPPASRKKAEVRARKDDGLRKVIINDKRSKRNMDFQITCIPYPYASRQEYEKAMAGAVGKEWNVTGAVRSMTRPEIQTRMGRIIRPLSKAAKAKRAAAKF